MTNSTTIGAGLGRTPSILLAWGLGGITAIVQAVIYAPPRYVLHGFNRMRLLQWGGRKPK